MMNLYKALFYSARTVITACLFMMLFTGISLLSYAQERVHYNGRDLFLSGMNVAWVNFAADLGPGYVDTSQFRTIFKAIHTNGGNSMRLWLHTNGTNTPSFNSSGFVIGPGVNAIQDLKNILKIAHQNNIGLQLSLWSHDILNQSELDTAKLHRNAKLISDTAYTMAYIRNSLIPMVQSVIGDSAIIAWEVFNEPEGITNEYGWAGRDHVPIADVQKAINLITGAIHRTDSHALVTSGANNFQTLTDNNTLVKLSSEYFNSMDPAHQDFLTASFNNSHRTNFTTKQYIGYLSSMLAAPNQNYYRDDRLIAAGGDILGTLDYYNVHFYGTQQMSPFNNAYSKWGLTKPLVAGEFYMQDDFGVPWQNLYEQLYTTGYAGGLSWAWNDNYNNVQRTYTEFVMNKMFSNHRNDIIVNPQIGTIYKYYANTTTIQVTDSATLYWDVEPGSVVTLNGNSVSSYDSIIVSPSVTTSYVLSASGQTSSSLSITITVLPTGRIMSFKALPSSIGIGENSLLTWQVVKGSTVTLNGLPVKVIDGLKVTPDSLNNSFVLRSQGTIQDSIKITILILQPILVNRALNQPVNVSSNDSVTNPLSKPQNINDGDNSTVWQAVNANGQWVQIDLVKNISLDKIVINWGNQGYASQYKIQLSENLASWQTIFTTLSGTGGVNNVETLTNLQGTGRYLIFLLQTRASGAFTIKDIQVYGLPSDTDIKFTDNTVPSSYALFQNYPNPFNPVTKINFSIPLRGRVKLEIYDLLGQRISTLVNRELQPGNYTEMLDARNLSSGIYFYTLRSENVAITKKMILLK